MNNQNRQINHWDFFKVFLVSFFLQAVWNFRSLISVGFTVCLFPILTKLRPDTEDKRQFFKRHLQFFNAHPYFASYALGVSIKLEEMATKGEIPNSDALENLKNLMISPLGAVGDRLFWATIKPACLIFGMLGIFLSPLIELKLIILLLTFLAYNIPHFYFRYSGILEGYKYGFDIYKYIGHQRFEKLRKWYLYFLVFSLVTFLPVYFWKYLIQNYLFVIIFCLAAAYGFILSKLINNFYLVCLGTVCFFLVVGILFF